MAILKLDLHTHMYEALNFAPPGLATAGRIVDKALQRGLDGLAITDHWETSFAFAIKRIVDEHFADANLLVIPGQELDIFDQQYVELYLPNRKVWRYLCHPGYPSTNHDTPAECWGIEIDNGMHNYQINKRRVEEIAAERNLLLLRNSDAHYLDKLGLYHSLIDWEALLDQASDYSSHYPQWSRPQAVA